MRFKPGQKIVCIIDNACLWTSQNTGEKSIGPKLNEIVTVKGYSILLPNNVILYEYESLTSTGSRRTFRETRFEPLIEDRLEEYVKSLESIEEPVTQ
jgi:hypothetical protein